MKYNRKILVSILLNFLFIFFHNLGYAEELNSELETKEIDSFTLLKDFIVSDLFLISSFDQNSLKNLSGFASYDKEKFSFDALDKLPHPKPTSEMKCLAEAIYFEARGETIEGQYAVGEVIINRVLSNEFPSSVCGVISEGANRLNACQFSYNCDGKLETINEKKIYGRILKLSKILLEPSARFLTGGATFYHSKFVSPSWSKKFLKTNEIGNHVFYKLP
jgi:hypothetical protein